MRQGDIRAITGNTPVITAATEHQASMRVPWTSAVGLWVGRASIALALLGGGAGSSWGLDPTVPPPVAPPAAAAAPLAAAAPSTLITLDSDDGQRLLFGSTAHRAYGGLSIHFVTQQHPAYCGVATMVMLLNAMGIDAPVLPGFEPNRQFTQDNALDTATEAVLPRSVLVEQGMTLAQFARLLEVRGRVGSAPGGAAGGAVGNATAALTTEVRHADDSSVDRFRREASAALAEPGQQVVVNYLRPIIGQGQGGHISPLAAYDAASDRFLILDVARYRYAPVWVRAADLYAAMNTVDASAEGRRRGYVLVRAPR